MTADEHMRRDVMANWGEDEASDDLEIIRAKWIMDGATTLAEAAAKLREKAAELDQLHRDGWTLEEPVADDYGTLIPPK